MTSYPQLIVYNIYMLGGYTAWLTTKKWKDNLQIPSKCMLLIALGCLTGLILSLPGLIDLSITARESARTSTDVKFFASILPSIKNTDDLIRFLSLSSVPELFGNPISPSYPFKYNGLSLSVTTLFFIASGGIYVFKKTWYWWLATALILILTFSSPIYNFAVIYLGLNLSRTVPLAILVVPLGIITAHSIEYLIETNHRHNAHRKQMALGITVVLLTTGIGITYGISSKIEIEWMRIIIILAICLLLLLFIQFKKQRPIILLASLVSNIIVTTYPLLLRQQFDDIAKTSPLTEKIKAYLPSGSRYAITEPGMKGLLPPNINASLGIKSIHTYNSLSSTKYHKAIKNLGGEIMTYGRHNASIYPDYSSTEFWMSNIGIILSKNKINHENLELMAVELGVYLYKNKSRMGESIQIVSKDSISPSTNEKTDIRNSNNIKLIRPIKTDDQGDLKIFKVTSTESSVLLLSQRYHRNWQAFAYTDSMWKAAKTLEFNTTYQAIILPSGTTEVRLEFKPFIKYAWLSQAFLFILSIPVCLKVYKSLSIKNLKFPYSAVDKINKYWRQIYNRK